jgi:hypothetical protein
MSKENPFAGVPRINGARLASSVIDRPSVCGARTMTEAQALGVLVATLLVLVYEFWLISHL